MLEGENLNPFIYKLYVQVCAYACAELRLGRKCVVIPVDLVVIISIVDLITDRSLAFNASETEAYV